MLQDVDAVAVVDVFYMFYMGNQTRTAAHQTYQSTNQ